MQVRHASVVILALTWHWGCGEAKKMPVPQGLACPEGFKLLEARSDDGRLLLHVIIPGAFAVGSVEQITASIQNVSDRPVAIPIVRAARELDRGHIEIKLIHLVPRDVIMAVTERAHSTRGYHLVNVARLDPGVRVFVVQELQPAVSGSSHLVVSFANSKSEVAVTKLHRVKIGEGPFEGGRYTEVNERLPDMWTGCVSVETPVEVLGPSRDKILGGLRPLAEAGGNELLALERLQSLIGRPNDLSVAVMHEYAQSIPGRSPLRTHCYRGIVPMILQGVGTKLVPALASEAANVSNPADLRQLLTECLAELRRKPEREAVLGRNYIKVTLDKSCLDTIERALNRLSDDPDETIARAAKAALSQREVPSSP